MHVKTLHRPGKWPHKRIRRSNPDAHTRVEIVPVLTSRVKNLLIPGELGKVLRNVLPTGGANFRLD